MVSKKKSLRSMRFSPILGLSCFILVVSLLLRFYKLDKIPGILNRDEAALAYNAKLIQESGKDEWGVTWPMQFRSFGDYKLPGYVMSVVVSFLLFGQNDFIVRLPSAIAGIVNVILVAALARKIVERDQDKLNIFVHALAFMAITPFAIFYSRMAWEANLSLSFFLISICLLFRTKVEKKKNFLGLLFYTISIFTYNTPLLLFPIILLSLVLFYWPLKKEHLFILFSLFIVFVVGIFSLSSVSSQKGSITIFSNETVIANYPHFRQSFPVALQSVIGNKYVYWTVLIGERYIQSWSPIFLVFQGGQHPWQNLPRIGHLYLLQYILALVGVIILIIEVVKMISQKLQRSKKIITSTQKWQLVFLIFIFFSPLPAVVTVDAPHATRSLFFLIMLVISGTLGLSKIFIFLKKKKSFSVPLLLMVWGLLVLSAGKYVYTYFVVWPQNYPTELMAGLAEKLSNVKTAEAVAIIDPEGYSYITVAWYKKFTPEYFFSTIQKHQPDQAGLSYGFKVGNYTFYKEGKDVQSEKIILYRDSSSAWQMKNL